MKNNNSGLIIKLTIAVVALAAASACFIVFRDTILGWLQTMKDKFFPKNACCCDEFADFADE